MMRRITIKLLTMAIALFFVGDAMAANIVPNQGATQTFVAVTGDMFYDTGGPGGDCLNDGAPGNYLNCADMAVCGTTTTTFTGIKSIDFSEYTVFPSFDWIKIYDGATTAGDLLFDGVANESYLMADLKANNLQTPNSSKFTSTTGALTIEFTASGVINRCGFAARISAQAALPPTACTLVCPPDVTVNVDPATCLASVTLPRPTTSGDCASQVMFGAGFAEGYDEKYVPTTTSTGSTALGPCNSGNSLFSIDCPDGYPAQNNANNANIDATSLVIDDDQAGAAVVGTHCFESKFVDLSGGGITLGFDWENENLGGAHVEVDVADFETGGDWVNVFTGPNADAVGTESVDISAYTTSLFKFRLCYNDGGAFAWGAAFDNVALAAGAPAGGAAAIINDYNGTEDFINEMLPAGVTPVTWSTTDFSGNVVSCVTNVTVQDAGPALICPGDITITLDGGECEAFHNYAVDVLSCNPAPPPAPDPSVIMNLPAAQGSNNGFAGVSFDVSNTAGEGIIITSFQADIPAGTHPTHLYVSVGSTYNGIQNTGTPGASDANWDFIGEVMVTGVGPGTEVPLGFFLPDGECKGVMLVTTDASMNYQNVNATNNQFSDGNLSMFPGAGHGAPFANNFGAPTGANCTPSNSGRALVGGISYALASSIPLPVNQTAGLPSGSAFPIGTTTNTFSYTDAAGLVGTCSFDVTVLEYPTPITDWACNDEINISPDADCEVLITADMILEGGPYGCYDNYIVELFTDLTMTVSVPNPVTGAYAGTQIVVVVSDSSGNSTCWGYANIEDKNIPDLECHNFPVPCDADPIPGTAAGIRQIAMTESNDTTTITQFTAIACNAGVYSYWRVVDLDALGLSGAPLTISKFRMAVEASNGGVAASLRFHTFTNPASYTAGQVGFALTDLTQIGATNDATIPAINLDYWQIPVTGVTIPAGTRWLVYDLEVPPSNFVMGSNGLGENSPTYISCMTAGLMDPQTLANVGFGANHWISMIFYEVPAVIPFPLPDTSSITVTPASGLGPFVVSGFDPCGDVTLTYEDEEIDIDCTDGSGLTGQIIRTWTAFDGFNYTTCQDTIDIVAANLASLTLPLDRDNVDAPALECHGDWDYGRDGLPAGPGRPADEGEGDNIPQPYEIGDEISSRCDIWANYEDTEFVICGWSKKIFREWYILDKCTGNFTNHTQVIIIEDTEGPVITCPARIDVGTDPYNCGGTWQVPAPDAYDACSEVAGWSVTSAAGTVINFGPGNYTITGLPEGCTEITYTVWDGCGNESVCVTEACVVDNIPPVAVCDQNTRVSLGSDGRAKVYAETIDDGSYDNCGVWKIEVRRVLPSGCYSPANSATVPRPYVEFCCEDVGQIVVVELIVTDYAGNKNSCEVNVSVEDKLPPVIVCPPNITVSCDFKFDLNNLGSTFGIVMDDEDRANGYVRQDLYIDDKNYQEDCLGWIYAGPQHVGQDGYAVDNCSVTVSEISNANLTCGKGVITRIFTAQDAGGRTSSCIQRITIVDCDPFYISDTDSKCRDRNGVYSRNDDVEWPCDVTLDGCSGSETSPAYTGRPEYEDDKCSLVADTFIDEVFTVVPDACFKILRHWSIIDWCQEDASTGLPLRWNYTQVIKVIDEEGPIVTPADPGCDENATDCSGNVDLSPTVEDCTPAHMLVYWWRIDAYNDGQGPLSGGFDFEGTSANPNDDIQGGLPYGTHRILWVIEDMCGNKSTTEYTFDVEDCKKPSPVCINGLSSVVMPSSGAIGVWAVDFDASSFDNCDTDLDFRIWYPYMDSTSYPDQNRDWTLPTATTSGDDVLFYLPSEAIFYCEALGNGVSRTFEVRIYVVDDAGNWDYCTTNITIDDNDDVCPDGTPAFISGTYTNEAGETVDNVMTELTGGVNNMERKTQMVNDNGEFKYIVSEGYDWNITGEKDDAYLNGVTAQDLSLIQRHIAGIDYLNSNYKLVAADANADTEIDIRDVLALRKLLLGIDDVLPSNESWNSIDAEYTFPGVTNTSLPADVYTHEMISFEDVIGAEVANFISVKTGDVDGDAIPNQFLAGETRGNRSLTLNTLDASFAEGDVVTVEFTADNFNDVTAYQFTFGFDQSVLEYTGANAKALNVNEANFGTQYADRGIVTTVWYSANAESVNNDEVLFSMTFKARAAGNLSSVINVGSAVTEAIAFSNETGKSGVDLQFNSENGEVVGDAFALFQNSPNPFKTVTNITYVLPESADVTLTVYDMSGRVLKTAEQAGQKGINMLTLDRSDVTGGVLYYQVETDDYSATKKMVVVE